jgi:hypothetical protein
MHEKERYQSLVFRTLIQGRCDVPHFAINENMISERVNCRPDSDVVFTKKSSYATIHSRASSSVEQ